jgi:hypothetical protein
VRNKLKITTNERAALDNVQRGRSELSHRLTLRSLESKGLIEHTMLGYRLTTLGEDFRDTEKAKAATPKGDGSLT